MIVEMSIENRERDERAGGEAFCSGIEDTRRALVIRCQYMLLRRIKGNSGSDYQVLSTKLRS